MEKSEDGVESGRVILSTKTSRLVFLDFKTNKLDALFLSSSEPLLYKNFDKVFKIETKSNFY